MILEKQTENLVLEEGESQKTYGTEIDMDSIQFLKQMLSKFYADPIGSLIRETASNALDSHRESGVKEPIIVSFKQNKDGNYEFSVEDFGSGINEETIEKVLRKYGKSTKRQSKDQLGMWGLGFKSPIAYTSSFYFIGRKNGIETKAMMYESIDDVDIDILYTQKTSERNGVKIIVPVKYGDKYSFEQKISEQLAYFEDVYFDCPNVKNDFKIIRHELFQYSTLCRDNSLHLCLSDVYYPIDFNKLGISRIDQKLALKFSLSDGIFPTPNRESIKYTKESIEIIKNKIAELSEYLVNKYNETITDTDDIFAVIRYHEDSKRILKDIVPIDIDLFPFTKYAKTKLSTPKLNGLKYLNFNRIYNVKDYLISNYSIEYELYYGKFSEKKRWKTFNINQIINYDTYVYTDKIAGNKKSWLRDIYKNSIKNFIKKNYDIPLFGKVINQYDNWFTILELKKFPKNEWRDVIKEAKYVISLLTKKFVDLDKLEVPLEWISARRVDRAALVIKKSKQRANKDLGEVTGKLTVPLGRSVYGKNCKFESTNINLKEAYKQSYFTVYGGEDCAELMNHYYRIFPKDRVRFVTFSARELKNLEKLDLHNWMEMEKFKKGEHKLFRRAVTAYLIHKLEDNNQDIFSKVNKIEEISIKLAGKIKELNNYLEKYYSGGDEEICEAMLSVAEATNLYDTSIYTTYKEIYELLNKLPFLNVVFKKMGGYNSVQEDDEKLVKIVRDLFKYYKVKIDWKYYAPEVDEIVKEEELVQI